MPSAKKKTQPKSKPTASASKPKASPSAAKIAPAASSGQPKTKKSAAIALPKSTKSSDLDKKPAAKPVTSSGKAIKPKAAKSPSVGAGKTAKIAPPAKPVAKKDAAKKEPAKKNAVAKDSATKPQATKAAAPKTASGKGNLKPEPSRNGVKPLAAKGSSKVLSAPASKGKETLEQGSKTKPAVAKHPTKSLDASSPKPASVKPSAAVARPIAARKPAEPAPPKPSDTKPEIVAKIRSAQATKELRKDLAQTPPKKTLTQITKVPALVKGQDRIILMVRDPYWLHAHWDITRQTVDRAKAALAEHWHAVKPVLRLLKLDDNGTTESAETVYRDLEIHGGVRNWYIDVDQPPSRFQIVMGYMTGSGRFYELVRSNTVITPVPGGKEASDDHWADIAKDAERIYAMSGGYGDETQRGELAEVFEERLNRTMDIDVLTQFGSGAEGGLRKPRQFHFDVDAEIVVFGSTHPDAHVTIGTDPVKVRTDGSFSVRLPFPDRRQVLPATARSRDGVDEQTVVIAVERNTKVMEPLSMDGDEP